MDNKNNYKEIRDTKTIFVSNEFQNEEDENFKINLDVLIFTIFTLIISIILFLSIGYSINDIAYNYLENHPDEFTSLFD